MSKEKMNLPSEEEGKKLFEVKEIEGTPFRMLIKDGTIKIIMGRDIISNTTFECEYDAIKYIESKPWELITALACFLAVHSKEIKNFVNQ